MPRLNVPCHLLFVMLTLLPLACRSPLPRTSTFAERVLPPPPSQLQKSASTKREDITLARADVPLTPPTSQMEPSPEDKPSGKSSAEMPPAVTDGRVAPGPLTLSDAVALSRKLQPRLRVYLEGVAQARGAETVAYAPYLPTVGAGYTVGGLNLNVGQNVSTGPGTSFSFLPSAGTVPLGLHLSTGYELAELQVQWLVADFGRRSGRYHQAQIGVNVAALQTDRAFQTVENDVALAFYQVLRTRSLKRIAEEAVRRAEDDLDVEKKLEKGGVVVKEKVLRAEVMLAQAKRSLDSTEAASIVAISSLNLAIGLNVSAATEIVPPNDLPGSNLSLADCLAQAVANRRELDVARLSIESAQFGRQVARADFRPKVVVGGSLIDLQQAAPRSHTEIAIGSIKLEWSLFEGGRRVGESRIANAKMRSAAAQAESLADAIAFQVNESYRQMNVARRGIDLSKPAVEQAREAYRLLRTRADRGDAIPAEVTEAETALTRAEQDLLNSTYDYLTAFTRLNFAMGLPPSGTAVAPPRP